jgi:hypothetical protein
MASTAIGSIGTLVALVSQVNAEAKGAEMACRHFVEERFSRCAAVRGLLIPSIYERERFCRSDEGCKTCPTFRAFEARGQKIPQEIYYQLWLPTEETPTELAEHEATEAHPPSV